MAKTEHTLLQVLEAVGYALNTVPNTKLLGCPHGFKDTYALAKAVDVQVYFRQENKEEGDA